MMRKRALFSLLMLGVLAPTGAAKATTIDAEIIRDRWGVPHIYAADSYSLFYANGYAQAQDRLAQMEILRHVGQGRLAELIGPDGLALDLVTRRELYTEPERVRALAQLPKQWRLAFEAFADGINRWISEVRSDPSKLPAEYPAIVKVPEDWKPTDTVAIAQFLLDVFGRGGGGEEVTNAKILDALTRTVGGRAQAWEALGDLVWVQRNDTYTTIKPEDAPDWETPEGEYAHDLDTLTPEQLEAIEAAVDAEIVDDAEATLSDAARAAGLPIRLGSNAQMIDGRFTATGKPILFGGPQMAYFTPMIPYELGMHGAGFDAVGMGVAGTPGVIIGRTRTQSWTVTSGSSDQVDLVVEKLTDRTHYLLDGVEQEMSCRTEVHVVRPGPADVASGLGPTYKAPLPDVVRQEVCRTIHGPVIYRTPDGKYAIASHRSYRGDELRSGALWLGIGQTQTLQQFREQLETFRFEFNFNYANRHGDIAYFHVGRQPLRDARLDPRLPRPGWDSSFEWKGALIGRQLPHVVNPSSGYLVNWNNNPARGWPSGDIREQWGAQHRAQLMDEALQPLLQRGRMTLDDARSANEFASTHHPFADEFYPAMRQAASASGRKGMIEALDQWAAAKFDWYDRDDDGYHDFTGFRLFELWREQMQDLVFGDELRPGGRDFVRTLNWDPATSDDPHAADHGNTDNKHTILVHALVRATEHNWCDRVGTPRAESCSDMAKVAFDKVAEGSGGSWQEPFPMRKIRFVPLGAGAAYKMPMQNKPSFQHFYDWGLPEGIERSRNVLPPGASGHMNTVDLIKARSGQGEPPHASDQLQMYVRFEDKPLLFDRAAVESFSESVVVLR